MKKHWWKLLAAGLLLYSFAAGLLIPLGSGIKGVAPSYIQQAGLTTLQLTTYNTDYRADAQAGNIKARLRLNDSTALCAKSVVAPSGNELQMQFDIPAGKLPIDAVASNNKKSPFPLLEIASTQNGYTSVQSAVAFAPMGDSIAPTSAFCAIEAYSNGDRMTFPFLNILEETIRNLYFHVPMWFGMMLLLLISVIYSIKYLRQANTVSKGGINAKTRYDILASSFASVGLLYGILGIITGALWAKNTWGAYWSWDVKQNTSAVALLIYMAYFVLRGSFEDNDQKARISSIYNIFAFSMLIPLLYIIPRVVDSLHPGMGGNPAFSSYDLDNTMRWVFYPAVIAWILMGVWISSLHARIRVVEARILAKMEA